jgi:hypothetical protein
MPAAMMRRVGRMGKEYTAKKPKRGMPAMFRPAILSLKKHLPNPENLKIVINLEIFYPR